MTHIHTAARPRQSGVSLIEVLVAILIFSFGIVGLMGLQARALQYSTSAEDTGRAALLANEIGATMVLSKTVAVAGLVPVGAYAAWQARVADAVNGGLPNGAGAVVTNGTMATITIQWLPTTAPAGATPNQYVTQVTLPP